MFEFEWILSWRKETLFIWSNHLTLIKKAIKIMEALQRKVKIQEFRVTLNINNIDVFSSNDYFPEYQNYIQFIQSRSKVIINQTTKPTFAM